MHSPIKESRSRLRNSGRSRLAVEADKRAMDLDRLSETTMPKTNDAALAAFLSARTENSEAFR